MIRLPLVLSFALFAACASSDGSTDASQEADAGAASATDGGGEDAGAPDAGATDAGSVDAGSADAGAGAPCSFNRDCDAWLRCECGKATATGCECAVGARGTGAAGTVCTGENDCDSAVCVEGSGAEYLCSKECGTAADCPTELPLCSDIAFVGRICVRQPPG